MDSVAYYPSNWSLQKKRRRPFALSRAARELSRIDAQGAGGRPAALCASRPPWRASTRPPGSTGTASANDMRFEEGPEPTATQAAWCFRAPASPGSGRDPTGGHQAGAY
ncbi:MAG: hypothetical protein WBN94_04180 [Methanothrix sp.]